MGLVRSLVLCVLVLLSTAIRAFATDYAVGDSSGWTTGADYTKWASDKSFKVGDNLVFNFVTGAHTVTEVTQSNYESCSSANAIGNSNSSPTTISLTSAGTRYFICGVPGHCSSGQKLAVTVGGSASGSTNGTTTPTYTGTYNSASLVPVGSSVAVLTGLVLLKLSFGLA